MEAIPHPSDFYIWLLKRYPHLRYDSRMAKFLGCISTALLMLLRSDVELHFGHVRRRSENEECPQERHDLDTRHRQLRLQKKCWELVCPRRSAILAVRGREPCFSGHSAAFTAS